MTTHRTTARLPIWAIPLLIAAAILAVGITLAAQLFQAEQQAAEARARATATRIERHLDGQIQLLESANGFISMAGNVDRARFRQFLDSIAIEQRASGMLGIGYALFDPLGADGEAAARLARDYGAAPQPPPTTAAFRATIVMLEPETEQNRRALGYDMYSEAVRRDAMDRAMRLRGPTATQAVRLLQGGVAERGPGFLVYVPHFADPADRLPRGFVYAPYRVEELIRAAVGGNAPVREAITVRMGEGEAAPIVFESGHRNLPSVHLLLHVADQHWTLEYRDSGLVWYRGWPSLALLGSALTALLLGGIMLLQARRSESLVSLAAERAGRAQDKDLLLAEMAHRLKNSYARMTALINLTARESESITDFADLLRGRIHSLADSTAMLTGEVSGRIALTDLISAELKRSAPDVDTRSALSGPALLLTEEETQAIGLTVHELSTNSIKYGALGHAGQLRVNWHQETDGAVTLHWVEAGIAAPDTTAPASGFGTRFITSMVERQLRGTLTRDMQDSRLAITIRWPHGQFIDQSQAATRRRSINS